MDNHEIWKKINNNEHTVPGNALKNMSMEEKIAFKELLDEKRKTGQYSITELLIELGYGEWK